MKSITWDYPNPHLLPLTVDDQHLDAMRHTNNVVYLAWVEQVAWHHSHQLGLSWDDYVRLGHGMVAYNARLLRRGGRVVECT
jgi:acyl-CoA thioester hydrolase